MVGYKHIKMQPPSLHYLQITRNGKVYKKASKTTKAYPNLISYCGDRKMQFLCVCVTDQIFLKRVPIFLKIQSKPSPFFEFLSPHPSPPTSFSTFFLSLRSKKCSNRLKWYLYCSQKWSGGEKYFRICLAFFTANSFK